MFVTGPHLAQDTPDRVPRIDRTERRTFAGPAEFLRDPAHRAAIGGYLSDLARPYRLDAGDIEPDEIAGHSYGEMGEALIRAVVDPDERVDLLVLAFAIHDVRPGRATATYLSHICPGTPFAFAICDQGTAAGFTGLRLIQRYASSGGFDRALLLIVEQAGLPYPVPVDAPMPSGHHGVAIRFDTSDTVGDGSSRMDTVRQHAGVDPDHVEALLANEISELSAGHDDVTVLLGAALAETRVETPRRVDAPDGYPYTGPWWELAGIPSTVDSPHRTVLADYDLGSRYLCLSVLDRG